VSRGLVGLYSVNKITVRTVGVAAGKGCWYLWYFGRDEDELK
jgi:hypothetical protein